VAVAQDITAVTFEKALHHIGSFTWQDKSVVAWLYRIAYNEAMQHHRRQRWLRPLQWLQGSKDGGQREPETAVLRHEHHTTLHHALHRLAKHDQDVLVLRFFEELTTEEIAAVLGCTPDNVYVRLHRALKRLRRHMTKLDPAQEVDYVA
jgi:RNA polymerase sigma-70 factor (ECF subfamily)